MSVTLNELKSKLSKGCAQSSQGICRPSRFVKVGPAVFTFGILALSALSKRNQSPIDIREDAAVERQLPPLILTGHWLNDGRATLSNDGERGMNP